MGKRVLIADDSPNTRPSLRFLLRNQGFELIEAEDGEEVLAKKTKAWLPDIIIWDCMCQR
ncbi:MAG TPA: response regulator [Planctomycetota bacterium]|nr:response regulator [Planctomycetota bacterium]